jgi:hypothetical protein
MSQQTIQLLEIALVALVFAAAILRLSRRQLISFRYTIGWLALCGVALLAGLLIPVVGPVARWMQVDEFTLVAAVAVVLLIAVCIQLSISISGLQRQVQKLGEDIAILREDAVRRPSDDR